MALIAFLLLSISRCVRSRSATALTRCCSIWARCAGSSRLMKSIVRPLIWDCRALANDVDRSRASRAEVIRCRQAVSSFDRWSRASDTGPADAVSVAGAPAAALAGAAASGEGDASEVAPGATGELGVMSVFRLSFV
jgi:hypothetical protein